MQSFQAICGESGITFQEITKVVKHLLYWGMGKVIYPIRPLSVYCLANDTAKVLQNPAVSEQLMQKLPEYLGVGKGSCEESLQKAL